MAEGWISSGTNTFSVYDEIEDRKMRTQAKKTQARKDLFDLYKIRKMPTVKEKRVSFTKKEKTLEPEDLI